MAFRILQDQQYVQEERIVQRVRCISVFLNIAFIVLNVYCSVEVTALPLALKEMSGHLAINIVPFPRPSGQMPCFKTTR